jgi:hypothetical protein
LLYEDGNLSIAFAPPQFMWQHRFLISGDIEHFGGSKSKTVQRRGR